MAKARKLSGKRKFNGKVFTKKGTHKLKSNAKKSAASARKAKKMARIAKSKSGYTVYTRG